MSLLLRGVLPVDWLSSWSERLVGIVLIAIGLWGFRRALSSHLHAHPHLHDGRRHTHIHAHAPHASHPAPQAHAHNHAALALGTLHGLAGGSHFLGVLPGLAFATNLEALAYFVAFGLGTVLSMTAYSTTVGLVTQGFATGGVRGYRILMGGCSLAAVVVGCFWIW
jgi:sulfite exporter TauE/SafE